MTLPIERSRPRRPVTWLTLIGVLLLPVVIGGILVAALYNPVERLDSLSAAIVNEDEAVTIDGQLVPLGRQLTAGLVEGSDDFDSNLTWVISNAEDAASGLADGTYAAVVTIPENFSSAATSTAPGSTPEQATIQITTPPDSLVVDDAITAQIASAAAAGMGTQLSTVYLENVLLGFTTLGEQLGEAADGASQLADGARQAADGTITLADGIRQLAGGAQQAADGTASLAGGIRQLAGGAGDLSSGLSQWSAGAREAAAGLDRWAAGAQPLAGNTRQIAAGVEQIGAGLAQTPQIPQDVVDAANALAANSTQLKESAADAAARLHQLAADCVAQGGSTELCDAIAAAAARADEALPTVNGIIDQTGAIAAGVEGLQQLPVAGQALVTMAGGLNQIAGGMDSLAGGATDAAAGVGALADGASQLSAGGAQLAGGAATAADGAAQLADGSGQLAGGAASAADGAAELGGGVTQLADGTSELADGLATATDAIPTYTDDEATDLATVVADPVAATGTGTSLFGASAIPLLATLALWFGGLGTFIALQAVSRRALTSRAPSALLALRAWAPAAGLGALQGLLVAGVVQLAASYSWAEWWTFAAVCVVAGIAFAAVNQALVAVFGGAGRWIAALIGVLAVATGIVSTAPGVLSSLASLMPTAPAYNGGVAALTSEPGLGAAFAGLIIWMLLSLVATILAVVRRRTTSARALLKAAPATA